MIGAVAPYTACLAPLLIFNVALSICAHSSLLVLSRLTLLTALGIAAAASAGGGGAVSLAASAATAGTVSALVAIWQGAIGFSRSAAELVSLHDPLRDPALARLRSGRVFGTFVLPASLGGGLAITLPLTIALAAGSRSRRIRHAVVAGVLLQAVALVWTFSIGAWASLALSCLVVLGPRLFGTEGGRRWVLGAALVLGLLIMGGIGARQWLLPTPGPEDTPVAYRLGNWKAAYAMVLDNPVTGTGIGTFGSASPGYRREGMNESRYAHCSWLQLVSELGFGVAPFLVMALIGGFALSRRGPLMSDLGAASTVGVIAFLTQNLVDFTFYQTSVGALFVAAVALAATESQGGGSSILPGGSDAAAPAASSESRSELAPLPSRWPHAWRAAGRAGMLLTAVPAGGFLLLSGLSGLAEERALKAHGLAAGDELRSLELAVRLDPLDPDLHSDLARALEGSEHDLARLPRARAEAERAASLDPRTPYRWWDLALIELRMDRPAAAWIHGARAASLYPLKPEYRTGLDALENRLFSPPPGAGESR